MVKAVSSKLVKVRVTPKSKHGLTVRVIEAPSIIGEEAFRSKFRAFQRMPPDEVIRRVQDGVAIQHFEELRRLFEIPSEELAAKVGMSRATFHRRQKEGKFTVDESDKVMRFTRLLFAAISVFGSEEQARAWLKAPQYGLGGAVPLVYAETEVGAREVEHLLGRIEHGVYS
jgi:putative toxin-antitoxin system antitoxin component (TIGR02293 family)